MPGLLWASPHHHGREGLGRWREARRPPTPQLQQELWAPCLHPRADAPFPRTRAAPAAGPSAPGRRAVFGKTGLGINQGRVRALSGIFEMNSCLLQSAKPGLPLGNPGLYQDGRSPHTPPVLPQGFSLGQMHLDLIAVKTSPLNSMSPGTPPGGPPPPQPQGGAAQLHDPLKLQAQTFLPGLQLGSDSFL